MVERKERIGMVLMLRSIEQTMCLQSKQPFIYYYYNIIILYTLHYNTLYYIILYVM